MQIELQVCSLDLAKRLKELGVRQESLFWWDTRTDGLVMRGDLQETEDVIHSDFACAFTVAELGEMLPQEVKSRWFSSMKTPHGWSAAYGLHDSSHDNNTEADARANLLIYLLENKLLAA